MGHTEDMLKRLHNGMSKELILKANENGQIVQAGLLLPWAKVIQVKVFPLPKLNLKMPAARNGIWTQLKDLMLLILINLLVGNVMLDTQGIIIREPDGSIQKEVTVIQMNPLAT